MRGREKLFAIQSVYPFACSAKGPTLYCVDLSAFQLDSFDETKGRDCWQQSVFICRFATVVNLKIGCQVAVIDLE